MVNDSSISVNSAPIKAPSRGGRFIAWLQKDGAILVLAVILLLAGVYRFTGVNWDEEQHLHPDERFLTMVSSSIRLPDSIAQYFDTDTSPLNPYNNNYGSFVYGTAPLFIVRVTAELIDKADYWNIHLVGRVLSAIFDLITCAMVFAIGRRLFDARAGLAAALLYACAVLPIQESHFFTVDAFGNVPIVVAFWFTLDIMEGKRGWLAYALAGAFFGLAVASRINFATYAAIIVLAGALRLVTLLNPVKRVGLAPQSADASERALSMDVGSVVGDEMSQASSAAAPATRTINLGPFVIELESRAKTADGENVEDASQANFWNAILSVGVGLAIAFASALLVFRVAQPYAFEGLVGLNPKWVNDMKFISQLIGGEIDYPPSHQWTGRAAYLFPLYNIFNYGLGFPFALAAWAGFFVGIYQILRYRKWNHLLLVLWIGGFFLYLGQQFVLVIRYYLPLYPFFAIYAGFFIFWLWDGAKRLPIPWNKVGRVATAIFMVVVVGYTVFWATAFTTIYMRPVTRIAASRWIIQNVPIGSVIANEHWDDPLPMRVDGLDPFANMYRGLSSSSDGMMQNYAEDDPEKKDHLKAWLNEADYIVLSSNRLYQSIPRLPLRYPLTTKYYQWLFDGELGFDLVKTFTSYPQLFGITINDDSSDEAFTVYDHPKVLIFKKSAHYSPEHAATLIDSVDLSELEKLKPIDAVASKGGFRMTPELAAANYAGGTWSEMFNPNDLANRVPVLAWLVTLWAIGLIAFPYAFVVFRRFADRGYALAKALGILGMAWLAWTLASYQALPFTRTTILLVLAAMLVGALAIVWRNRRELGAYVRSHWKLLGLVELVFLGFFALDLLIRYGNPDLWHPWFGGEKPMDFAYLNAIIKTTYFPAYNPWFEGGFINYYYFGQVISAALVKLTGIVPEVAYNLLLPLFFGLTAVGAFGVGFNLVARGREMVAVDADEGDGKAQETAPAQTSHASYLRPILAGLAATVLVLIIGNLGQVGVMFKGLTDLGQAQGAANGLSAVIAGLTAWLGGKEIPVPIGNWYWTATRVIPDTINEMPFFTFVYADLHAHLMALPFTLVGLGIAAHAVFERARLRWYDLGIAALVLGALRAINTWDYPTYLALVGCAMVLGFIVERRQADAGEFSWGETLQRYLWFLVLAFVQVSLIVVPTNAAGIRVTLDMGIYILVILFALAMGLLTFGIAFDPRRVLQRIGWRMVALIALSVLFYLPYILNYGTAYTSVELWKDARTTLPDYLIVHGIFLFLTASYLVVLLLSRQARTLRAQKEQLPRAPLLENWGIYLIPALLVLEIGLTVLGSLVFAIVLPLLALAAWVLIERDTAPVHRLLALLLLAALLLTIMVEVVTLKGDIGRMNTVFKFYLQAWVFFAVANAVGLTLVLNSLWFRSSATDPVTGAQRDGDAAGVQVVKAAWWGVLAILIFAGLLYPAFAGWAKVNDRFVADSPPGLNGMDYMKAATYDEQGHQLVLAEDLQAIQWLRENIKGSPVIAEANTGLYRWGDRVSINTGLPTIIGWDWHTKQQYSLLPGNIIDDRIRDLSTLYNTSDPSEALDLLRHYNVSLIYVGPLERAVYDAGAGMSKFDAMAATGVLRKVYDENGVQIYALTDRVAQVVK